MRRCACLLLVVSFAAAAQDPQAEVTFRGFGTVGAVHSDTAGAQFVRDVRQPALPRSLRISVGTPGQNARLLESLA